MQLYLTGAVPVHLPGDPGFFMVEPLLVEAEGSQRTPPCFLISKQIKVTSL